MTSNISLGSAEAPFDYTDFLRNAEQLLLGNWFGPYNNVTLIKGPGIELYVALIRNFGIPLPLGHQVVYALASLLVAVAIRPLVPSGWWRGLIFCLVLFNPTTFDADAWILNRSQFIPMASITFVACGIGAILRANGRRRDLAVWLAFLGLAASLVWMTREDTVWIFPSLAVFLAAYLWSAGAFAGRLRSVRVALAVMPLVVFAAAVGTIMAINNAEYGWPTTVEMTAPDFVSAYQSLTRIEVPGFDNRVYPAPAPARAMAYAASPAAAELKPYFDVGDVWKQISCSQLSLCADVSAGWFVFAFRDAVQGAGYYSSGSKARAFYIRLSRELDAACEANRLPCRAKSASLAPALRLSDLPGTIRYAAETVWHAAAYDQFVFGGLPVITAADEDDRRIYRNATGSGDLTSYIFSGWVLHPKGGSVRVQTPSASDFAAFEPFPSPDLRSAFGKSRQYAGDDLDEARFEIAASCLTGCFLVVDDGPGHVTRIPLDAKTLDVHSAGVTYHLDSEFTDPPTFAGTDWKVAAQTQVVKFYQDVVRWWIGLAVLAALFRVARAVEGKRPLRSIRAYVIVGATALTLLANCGVLGLVSAVSFYALFPEYESSIFPLLLIALAATTAIEADVLVRAVRRRIRPELVSASQTASSSTKDAS